VRVRSNLPRRVRDVGGLGAQALVAPEGMTPGLAPVTDERVIAPWPQVDRYPIVIGSRLTFDYIAACMRMAVVGYRMMYVDLLSELIDHEPRGMAALHKQCVAIASARYEVVPAVRDGKPEADLAKEIAEHVEAQLAQIPFWVTRIFQLAWWGGLSAVGAHEIVWRLPQDDPSGAGQWWIDSLQFIHSRRLSYPNWMLWDLHVWDQGMGGGMASDPIDFGVRMADYPDKFVAHTPSLRAEYANREGRGRILTIYFALKRLVVRCSAQDFERFVKPWVVAYYSTSNMATGKPRVANDKDVAMADAAMRGAGLGSLAGLTLPDSIKLELLKAITAMSATEFLAYLDEGIELVCSGQSYTASPGETGARAASQVATRESLEGKRYETNQMAETIRATLARTIVRLNYPGMERLTPFIVGHVEPKMAPKESLELATMAANVGAPVDGVRVCKDAGVPLVPVADGAFVRLAPLAPVAPDLILPDGSIKPAPEPAKGPAPAEREKL